MLKSVSPSGANIANTSVVRVLGIDPGSRITGFGVIELYGFRMQYIASGCVRLGNGDMPRRLRDLFSNIVELVNRYQPMEVAIERVFVHDNVASALQLGQARGVALCAVALQDRPIFEYAPTQIKKAVVGQGRAAKEQVQFMAQQRLNLSGLPQADAADALAVAMCHAQLREWRRKTEVMA